MDYTQKFREDYSYLGTSLLDEMLNVGSIQEIPKNTEILREGQYIKVIPLVIDGAIKVFSQYEDKELLLYYIQTKESCVMSFSSGLKNEPSKGNAITEEDTVALLLPIDNVIELSKTHTAINLLFHQLYNQRYSDLIDTINHLLFDKLDKRVLDYLTNKSEVINTRNITITHRQIASELGTAREVVSRVVKKLEKENLVKQHSNSIEIL